MRWPHAAATRGFGIRPWLPCLRAPWARAYGVTLVGCDSSGVAVLEKGICPRPNLASFGFNTKIGEACLYRPQQLTLRFRLGCVTDGSDDGRVETSGTTGGFGGYERVIHGGVFSVGQVMAPQVVPQILDWI